MKKTIKIPNELKLLLEESFSFHVELNYLESEFENTMRKIKDYQYKHMFPDFAVEHTSQGKIENVYNMNELNAEEIEKMGKQQSKIILDLTQRKRVEKITTLSTIKGL